MAASVSRPRYNESNSDTPTNQEEEEEQGDTVYAPVKARFAGLSARCIRRPMTMTASFDAAAAELVNTATVMKEVLANEAYLDDVEDEDTGTWSHRDL